MKRALITGIAGQDGSYLAELLLHKGYEVYGIESPEIKDKKKAYWRLSSIIDKISIYHISILEIEALYKLFKDISPDECYHLAACSFVHITMEEELKVIHTNIEGTHNILRAIAEKSPYTRLLFAGSSEMFGNPPHAPQTEKTPFYPRTVYGISKLTGHNLCKFYRENRGIFTCTAILYNHESPRRGEQFVTRRITRGIALIKSGKKKQLFLKNTTGRRDWGHAKDYVRGMYLMLQQKKPDDYILATNALHSVEDFLIIAFKEAGMGNYKPYVQVEENNSVNVNNSSTPLVGNPQKAKNILGWEPSYSFQELVREMVYEDLKMEGISI